MGLLMRRRRPVMRLAAGAAVGTAAYQAGKRRGVQDDVNAQAAPVANPPVAAPPAPAGGGTTAELERLTQLHASGALTDAEFAAAKSKLLGI